MRTYTNCIYPFGWRSVSQMLSALLLLLVSVSAFAELPTPKMVDDQIALISDQAETDPAEVKRLQRVKRLLNELAGYQSESKELQQLQQEAPKRKAAQLSQLEKLQSAKPKAIDKKLPPTDLEQLLATEKARNKTLVTELEQLSSEQQELLQSQESLPEEIANAEQRLDELKEKSSATTTEDPSELWLLETQIVHATEKLVVLSLQQDTLLQRRELAKVETQILTRELSLAETKIEQLQSQLLETTTQTSLRTIEEAKRFSRTLADAPEVIQQWNQQNETLAQQSDQINRHLLLVQQKRQVMESERVRLNQSLAQIKANLRYLRQSPAFVDTIRSQLAQLPDLSERVDLAETITNAHVKRFQLDTEITELAQRDNIVENTVETAGLDQNQARVLDKVLSFRQNLLSATLEKTDQLIAEITQLEALKEQFAAELNSERDYLREKQLFIRGRPAIWEQIRDELPTLFGLKSTMQYVRVLLNAIVSNISEVVLLGLITSLLFVLAFRLRKLEQVKQRQYVKAVGKVKKDAFANTIVLVLLSLVYAALVSVWLFGLDQWIAIRAPALYSLDLKALLTSFAIIVFSWEVAVRLSVPEGVLSGHLGWPNSAVSSIKATLSQHRWPLYLLLCAMVAGELFSLEAENLPLRIAFVALVVWLMSLLVTLMKPNRVPALLPQSFASPNAQQLMRFILLAPLAVIIGAAIWGYFYAAWLTLFNYYVILLVLVSTVLLHQLGIRWLKVEQRTLALQRALAKREEQHKREQGENPIQDDVDDAQLPVEDISEQSKALLNVAVVVYLFAMLSTLLSDSLVVFGWMREVTIWEVVTTGESGSIVEAITLLAALKAVVILVLALFAARNLPGLLELLVLHRFGVSRGAAYATTTLMRYSLVMTGVLVSFSIMGFHWSKLQWLVAALGVGLGFGLQEIFANLVSGIILLFERPVRVGDTVTINDLTGTVTRINTRATTIVDWDKKEIVVPNKTLITDQLINWSLSDAVTRLVFPIGVAYGSDIPKVKTLLLQAATSCETVIETPEPMALFMGFGNSTLDFELRVFLAQVDQRITTQDKLNTEIERLFKENDVEIAFPQLDVNVRDLPSNPSGTEQK